LLAAGSRPLTGDEKLYLRLLELGVPEGVTLLEFEGLNPEERPAAEEQEVPAPEGGAPDEELPECPNHQPSSFIKGKPRSILSLLCL
jgi:hypothetical protein